MRSSEALHVHGPKDLHCAAPNSSVSLFTRQHRRDKIAHSAQQPLGQQKLKHSMYDQQLDDSLQLLKALAQHQYQH